MDLMRFQGSDSLFQQLKLIWSNRKSSDKANQPGAEAGDFPPDPLLASGSFISSIAGDWTVDSRSGKQLPIKAGISLFSWGGSVPIMMANITDQMNPSPGSSVHKAKPSKPRKRPAPGENWLPPGWRVEGKVRTSGATAGLVDKYYYEPITGRKFRSRTEVLTYLKDGTIKKRAKKAKNTDVHSANRGRAKGPPMPPPPPPMDFDFHNPPEMVSWSTPTDGGEARTPSIGGVKVPVSAGKDWFNALTLISSTNPSKLTPRR